MNVAIWLLLTLMNRRPSRGWRKLNARADSRANVGVAVKPKRTYDDKGYRAETGRKWGN